MQNQPTRFQNTDGHPGRHVFIGLGIATVGTLALLDNLRVFDVALLRTFWPLALVLLGLARLVWPGNLGSRMSGVALMLVGAMLTAGNLGSDLFALHRWWPVFIIVAGLSLLLRRGTAGATPLHGDDVAVAASFSNLQRRSDTQGFKGGRVDLDCASLDLDLRAARMDGPEAVLQIRARFSGLVLQVPQGWQVVVDLAATAGGVEDRTVPAAAPGAPRLVLCGDTLFSGVEIRH